MLVKSLEELSEIRNRAHKTVEIREKNELAKKVVVGMGTRGIASGARAVLQEFVNEVTNRGLDDVSVQQSGATPECRLEPLVEVFLPGKEKITYAKVQPEMVSRIVTETLVNGDVVPEYTARETSG